MQSIDCSNAVQVAIRTGRINQRHAFTCPHALSAACSETASNSPNKLVDV